MPQLPTTQVVTPPHSLKFMCGCRTAAKSSCVCTSMKPGASARPRPSSVSRALPPTAPTAAIRSPSIATSAMSGGAPLPSYTDASRITVS